MIFIHILIALSSLCLTTFTAIKPSQPSLRLSLVLIALTLATGTYLVLDLHTPMLRACATGLAYLAVALSGVIVGSYRLAHARQVDQ